VSAIPTPAIGQPGTSVKVTMVEQGSVGYIVNAEATSVARSALMNQVKQLGAYYTLLSNTVLVGKPAIQSVNTATGQIALKIAASGVAVYQFPDSELQYIRDSLKGKTLKAATSFLTSQPGVDPHSIAIHFTQGKSNSLPDSTANITVVPLNVATYPQVHLKTIPSPTGNTTTNTTPTATVTPTGTSAPQDN
jgi:hypothetical protein